MRLTGPRRVAVHEDGVAVRVLNVDDTLTAPGVLALPVPVRALFERDAAHEITLRNLLSSKGSSGLEAVRDEGLGPLVHLFERKLARPLTASERAALRDRLATGGPARLGDVVIDLDAADLDAWIKDPSVP